PLEDRTVSVARASRCLHFPANIMLVAAMNPCPCGWRGSGRKECSCSPLQGGRYLSKISGPLLDRIDIHLQAQALKTADMLTAAQAEPSAAVKQRAGRARAIQQQRLAAEGLATNGQLPSRLVKTHCVLDEQGRRLLKQAVDTLGLSARGHDRILRVAR